MNGGNLVVLTKGVGSSFPNFSHDVVMNRGSLGSRTAKEGVGIGFSQADKNHFEGSGIGYTQEIDVAFITFVFNQMVYSTLKLVVVGNGVAFNVKLPVVEFLEAADGLLAVGLKAINGVGASERFKRATSHSFVLVRQFPEERCESPLFKRFGIG